MDTGAGAVPSIALLFAFDAAAATAVQALVDSPAEAAVGRLRATAPPAEGKKGAEEDGFACKQGSDFGFDGKPVTAAAARRVLWDDCLGLLATAVLPVLERHMSGTVVHGREGVWEHLRTPALARHLWLLRQGLDGGNASNTAGTAAGAGGTTVPVSGMEGHAAPATARR